MCSYVFLRLPFCITKEQFILNFSKTLVSIKLILINHEENRGNEHHRNTYVTRSTN